jgi:hypothetical protein
MSTKQIYIPHSILELLQFHKRRKEFTIAVVLAYSIIDGWSIRTKTDSNGKKWRPILRSYFDGISGKRQTVSDAIEWLEVNGFIEIKKRVSKAGKIINDNKKDKYPNRYRIKNKKKWTTFAVDEDRYYRAYAVTTTGDDWASIATRRNLALLSRIDGIEVREKSNRANRQIWTLENNSGTVRRGKNVDRLYSPFCFASEEVRSMFLFDNEPWVSFDLGSAQPTIVGKLANDTSLMIDCMNDELYPSIAMLLNYDPIAERKKAKEKFYRYCYGPILKDGVKQPEAFVVQDYISRMYPKTHAYAVAQKQPDYRQFARWMQNLESQIFINLIFAELVKLKIPALTCHDGIYCPLSRANQVEQIARSYLSSYFGNLYVLNSFCNQEIDSECIS